MRWVLDEGMPLDPDARIIRAIVSQPCVSSRWPAGSYSRLSGRPPTPCSIVFTVVPGPGVGQLLEEQGTVYGSRSRKDAAVEHGARRIVFDHCAPGAPVEVDVDLGEPLGDRRLVDGATWPARDARQPLDH